MKILIFLEHDIIIRHFIKSGVFQDLIERANVLFVFPEVGNKRVGTDVEHLELGAPYLHLPSHQARLRRWKRMFQIDRLRWRRGRQFFALRRFFRFAVNGFEQEWSRRVLRYTLLGLPLVRQMYFRSELKKMRREPNSEMDELFSREQPDLIVHPCVMEGTFINDLAVTAKEKSVPLLVIMNSWDNPSTKQAMVPDADFRLLVWGDQTRNHAIEYAGIRHQAVTKFGAAQFEVYRQPPRIDREEFCRQHEINPESRLVLYAGSSKGSDEFSHLLEIENAIESHTLGHVTVVYRPHPWGKGGKGGDRILQHRWKHVRIENSMKPYLEGLGRTGIEIELADYRATHDVLSSVDVLISPLSTIILEAALHGKPAMCFLPGDEEQADHYDLVAPFVHFDEMFQMPEFIVARGRNELVNKLVTLLSHVGQEDFAQKLRKACEFFVEPFEEPYSKRLAELAEEIISGAAVPDSDR